MMWRPAVSKIPSKRGGRQRKVPVVALLLGLGTLSAAIDAAAQVPTPWSSGGADTRNDSAMYSPPGATQLSSKTVAGLKVKWFFPTTTAVPYRPSVETGGLYFVDSNQAVYKLDPVKGTLLWQVSLPNILKFASGSGSTLGTSRTTPAIASDRIVLSVNGLVLALKKTDGSLLWATQIDSHPLAFVHTSPVIAQDPTTGQNRVFVGVAGGEEGAAAANPSYVPYFRGSAMALDLATGKILWKTYTAPASPVGYTGAGIWGSTAAVNGSAGLVYFTTGNNFTVPAAVGMCVRGAGTSETAQRACLVANDYVDSILAFSVADGHVVWSRPTIGADASLYGDVAKCSSPTVFTCPTIAAPADADFASGPNLVNVNGLVGVKDDRGGMSAQWMIGAGQKTGVYWALNPANGGLFWSTAVVNGGPTKDTGHGNILWGSTAAQGSGVIFVALNNPSSTVTNTLVGRNGAAVPGWVGGAWAGINGANGRIIFQIPSIGKALDNPAVNANTPGPLTAANDIYFGGDTGGYLTAFDATGLVRWTYNTHAWVRSGPSVFNDWLYWGVGGFSGSWPQSNTTNTGVYGFSLQ